MATAVCTVYIASNGCATRRQAVAEASILLLAPTFERTAVKDGACVRISDSELRCRSADTQVDRQQVITHFAVKGASRRRVVAADSATTSPAFHITICQQSTIEIIASLDVGDHHASAEIHPRQVVAHVKRKVACCAASATQLPEVAMPPAFYTTMEHCRTRASLSRAHTDHLPARIVPRSGVGVLSPRSPGFRPVEKSEPAPHIG
jgi:hypothetical protein